MKKFFVLVRPAPDEANRTTLADADAAYDFLVAGRDAGRWKLTCFARTGGAFWLDLDVDSEADAEKLVEEMLVDYPLRDTITITVDEEVPLEVGFATLKANIVAAQSGVVFDLIGGASAVEAVVDDLFARVLGDALLAPRFDGIDMNEQRRHMRQFITTALGGPDIYRGRTMAEAHASLGITGTEFDQVAGHLKASLDGAGVPTELVAQILATVATQREPVVTA